MLSPVNMDPTQNAVNHLFTYFVRRNNKERFGRYFRYEIHMYEQSYRNKIRIYYRFVQFNNRTKLKKNPILIHSISMNVNSMTINNMTLNNITLNMNN